MKKQPPAQNVPGAALLYLPMHVHPWDHSDGTFREASAVLHVRVAKP